MRPLSIRARQMHKRCHSQQEGTALAWLQCVLSLKPRGNSFSKMVTNSRLTQRLLRLLLQLQAPLSMWLCTARLRCGLRLS